MRTFLVGIAAGLVVCGLVLPADAESHDWDDLARDGIVIDHQPVQTGGGASDTEYEGGYGWQRVADDVVLDADAMIRHIVWWGFYDLDDPPVTETMRIRFYAPRGMDGLPGDVLYEQSFLDPSRTATGRTVWVGVDPDEYVYEVDLPTPFELAADTPYWLEIVQVGDMDTRFRWEFSLTDLNGQAFINAATGDWTATSSIVSDTAFQLSTVPEPSALGLISLGAILAGKRRSRKEAFDKELQE